MRNDDWLVSVFEHIWNRYFSDIDRKNPISIAFGRKSKRRLGSIILTKDKISKITLTGYFKDPYIPEYVLYETIAHELIHYIHGFSSTLEKQFKHPHQGGIIRKEMTSRGLGPIYKESKAWMGENWHVYMESFKTKKTAMRPKQRVVKKHRLIRFFLKRKNTLKRG